MKRSELKEYLDEKFEQYNHRSFIETDPIQLVHRFERKEDIEIVGLLVSTIAWGKREMIIKSGERMLAIMGDQPFEFVSNYSANALPDFVHRTFNGQDLDFFFRGLQSIYQRFGSLETAFAENEELPGVKGRIVSFRNEMFKVEHEKRSEKHVSDPSRGSAAKRLNMYLRWMVREDVFGVDLGLWKKISPALLSCPLDVHSGNVARKLGLLTRKQNDGKALKELDKALRKMDPLDPVKYDFALFGLGVFAKF